MVSVREGNTIEELRKYYLNVVQEANKLLLEKKNVWETNFNRYLETPNYLGKEEYWFKAYDEIIKRVESETGASFYFSTQGLASLRFNGVKVVDEITLGRKKGTIVKGSIDKKKGFDLSCPETVNRIKEKIKDLKEKEKKRTNNPKESYYEAGILFSMDEDNKNGINSFYRYIQPIKRINNGKTKSEKREIGLFQMTTPFSASGFKNKPQKMRFSGSKGGGIDILARRGNGSHILTLIEIKNEYKRRSEPPEITMGQLIAYAVFMCNLIEEDPYRWGRAFGFMGGYKKKELNLIVMLPMPDDKKPPRTDFLSEDSKGSDIEVDTINATKYVLHLNYAYFDPGNYIEVKYQSIGSLD